MINRILFFLFVLFIVSSNVKGQVQVQNEPRHKNVFENKYVRILNVNIQPRDTTQFHIHSTPSVFLIFTNTITATQIKGQDWTKSQSVAGNAWYRSFLNDTLIHRVTNCDTVPFHVNDVEILSAYDRHNDRKSLPFTVLFDNDKAAAYHLTSSSLNKQTISNRGPMVAGLVSKDDIVLHDTKNNRSIRIKAGRCTYIEPGSTFYLTATSKKEIDLVLFEIK